jgi:thiol:disulfide interchange protein DsbG
MRFFHMLSLVVATAIVCIFATSLYYTAYRFGHHDEGKKTILAITHNNVTVVREFKAINGLQGFVVKAKGKSGRMGIMYTDHSGRYLVMGPIIKATGENITQQEAQRYILSGKAVSVYNNLPKQAGFIEGNADAPHKIIAIMDPNCIFCHRLYEALKPQVLSGQLAVKWIVAGFLKPGSAGKAYAILSAKDPAKALAKNEANFNEHTEEGAITPISNPSATIKQAVADANAFLQNNQLPGTPAVIYLDQNHKPQLIEGMPNQAQLKIIFSQSSNQF